MSKASLDLRVHKVTLESLVLQDQQVRQVLLARIQQCQVQLVLRVLLVHKVFKVLQVQPVLLDQQVQLVLRD